MRPSPHLCAEPGCPTVVEGPGRCAEHGRSSWDRWRCTPAGRARAAGGYGWRWTRERNAYLAEHPSCERCGDEAHEVHHRDGRSPNEPGANEWRNLESLCRRCHRRARVGARVPSAGLHDGAELGEAELELIDAERRRLELEAQLARALKLVNQQPRREPTLT
jgi:5-methylcytosine-specific restriction protein A